MTDSNIPDPLPKSPEEERPLRAAITRLLKSIPEVWESFDYQKLPSFDLRALVLLTAAGMVERRLGMRVTSVVDSFAAEIEIEVTGENGFEKSMETVTARMWETGEEAYTAWHQKYGRFPHSLCQTIYEAWRLSDQGVIAREDLDGNPMDRACVFDFLFRRHAFLFREPVNGYGTLTKFVEDRPPAPVTHSDVTIKNWDEGAKEFKEQLSEMVSAQIQPMPSPPTSLWRFEPGEAFYKDIRIPIKGPAWSILKKLAENFGRPVRKDTLVGLMEEDSDASPETWLRDSLKVAREAVRTALKLDKTVDPIPNTERGRNAAWKLDDKYF